MGDTFVRLWRPIAAMVAVIVSSNWLVQFPINDWLTWRSRTPWPSSSPT